MKPLELRGSCALVTGASSGIGREIARLLAAHGCRLILCARRSDRLETLAGELRKEHGGDVRCIPVDLSNAGALETIAQCVGNDVIDLLINNAGIGGMRAFDAIEPDQVARMIEVNLTTHCRLTRLVLPGMIAKGGGGVLNIGSVSGLQAAPYMTLYSATKAFLVSFSEGLHQEVKSHGVRVACVCPGPVRTEFFEANEMTGDPALVEGAAGAPETARFAIEALRKNRVVAVPGLANRIKALIAKTLPRAVSGRLALGVMEKRMAASRQKK